MPKGGNGKGKNKTQPVPPQPTVTILDPIIDVEINLTSEVVGTCTRMRWDAQPNDQGYNIRILDDCHCTPQGVDSDSIPGETHYIKYYNAFDEEAWMGCLYEIGKDRTYNIRMFWSVKTGDNVQPYYSKVYSVYVA